MTTIRFDMADLLTQPQSVGENMQSADNPRRLLYRDGNPIDNYNTWGATYEFSNASRYNPNDPDFTTASAHYATWLGTEPTVKRFNISLLSYDGSRAWGQSLMLANPPADWGKLSIFSGDMWATITGDFALDRDFDGTADAILPQLNESLRFWVGTDNSAISTTDAQWAQLGIDRSNLPESDPQLHGVLNAIVVPEPSGLGLLGFIIGAGLLLRRKTAP